MFSATNQFQFGDDCLRQMLKYQKGVRFTMNTSQLSGKHKHKGEYYDFRGSIIGPAEGRGKVMVSVLTDDGPLDANQCYTFELPPVVFLDDRTHISWNSLPDEVHKSWNTALNGQDHANSIHRASRLMKEYLKHFTSSREDIVLLFDGNGESRYGMTRVLEEQCIPRSNWPRILTFEFNPNVALTNKIVFGKDIIFTGSSAKFSNKGLHNFETKTNKVPLEHLFVKQNDVLTKEMKEKIRVLYLDYCGGPVGNQQPSKCHALMTRVLSELDTSKLIFGVTLSYRRHEKAKIEDYMPLGDFTMIEAFRHKKVLSNIYKSNVLSALSRTREERVHYNRPRGRAPQVNGQAKVWDCTTGTWIADVIEKTGEKKCVSTKRKFDDAFDMPKMMLKIKRFFPSTMGLGMEASVEEIEKLMYNAVQDGVLSTRLNRLSRKLVG